MLNNLMRAHGLHLLNYEPPTQDPTFQEALNEGSTREEREDHSQDDASSGRSRSPSHRTRRPLEREDNSLRNRVQESKSKRRRSPSHEVSSSPSPGGRKRERERHARRCHKPKWTPSLSSSPSKRSSFSSSSSRDGYSSKSHHKRRRPDTHHTWKRSRKLQKFKEGGKRITFQTYDGSYGAIDKVLSFIQQYCAGLTEDIRVYVNDQKPRTIVEVIHRSKMRFQELPPSRGQDDHKIEPILGSSSPNIPPYRVSYAQQEEILTQVNELLEKGKRKREGVEQFEQSHVVGLQEVSHPAADSIDLHHNSPPPPGWEQCLDLQSGQMYFVNPATQMRVACDPQCNLLRESAAGQGKNGKCYSGMTLGLDLEMKLPSSAASIGVHSLPFRDNGPAVHPRGNASLGSSLNLIGETLSSDISMAATCRLGRKGLCLMIGKDWNLSGIDVIDVSVLAEIRCRLGRKGLCLMIGKEWNLSGTDVRGYAGSKAVRGRPGEACERASLGQPVGGEASLLVRRLGFRLPNEFSSAAVVTL
ncbi:hypothetical protein L7F22_062941 [Adiantum nelumboides]|nr:hypothetical protein [Adiantum nelumboides]